MKKSTYFKYISIMFFIIAFIGYGFISHIPNFSDAMLSVGLLSLTISFLEDLDQ